MIDEKHRAPKHITRKVKRAEDALSTDKANARRYVKLLHGVLPRKRAKRSNLAVRKIYAYVENAVSRDVTAQFQYANYFDLESRSGQDTKRADNAEATLQYYLERAELPMKYVVWCKQSLTENIGVKKLGWRKTVRKQRQRMPLDEALQSVPNFELPDDLKGLIAYTPDGVEWSVQEGPLEEKEILIGPAGKAVTLDQAPPEIQRQFPVVVDVPKVIYDGLDIVPIDFQDCFWDTDAGNVDEIRWAGHHFGATLKDLEDQAKSGVPYKNLKVLKEWAEKAQRIPSLARYTRRADLGKASYEEFDEDETLFKVTEFWHIQDQKLYAYVTTGGDSYNNEEEALLIREEDFPYWHGRNPYHYLPASVIPFEIGGVGIPELIEHLYNERNELKNIQMDQKVLSIMPPVIVNTNADPDIKAKLQNMEPGKVVDVELDENIPLSNIIHFVRPDATAMQNVEFLIRSIDADMEDVTGIQKILTGAPIARRTTYSEQAMLAGEANLRLRLRLMVNDAIMKRFAGDCLRLLDQFCDPVIEVRITGDDKNPAFIDVPREDLSFEYDIFPASSSAQNLANQLAEAQQMNQAYQSIRGTAMEQRIKAPEFLRELFRKSGVKNAEKFIYSDEEWAQMQQAQAVQQQAQQQQMMQQGAPAVQSEENGESKEISDEQDLLAQGQVPEVRPEQDHAEHYRWHSAYMEQRANELRQQGAGDEQIAQDPVVVAIGQHVGMHVEMSPELAQSLEEMGGMNDAQ